MSSYTESINTGGSLCLSNSAHAPNVNAQLIATRSRKMVSFTAANPALPATPMALMIVVIAASAVSHQTSTGVCLNPTPGCLAQPGIY